jgi:membrane protease subunit HflK
VQERLKTRFGGGGGGGGAAGGGGGTGGGKLGTGGFAVMGALALVAWASTGVFVVDAGEEAIVLQFGNAVSTRGAGIHLHLPQPIETHEIVQIEQVRRTTVGFTPNGRDRVTDVAQESLMLTGDENIVDIDFAVLWRVSDSVKFQFTLQDADSTVKAVAESAMREVVGKRNLEPIITRERNLVERETQELIQKTLDAYDSGILITQVQLSEAGPPSEVIDAFRDVVSAQQDADTARNQATAYANRVVTEARGQAGRIISDAEAYRESVVSEATGEGERFNQIYAQYRLNPRVTRERMYFETMEKVLERSQKIIIDGGNGGAVPFLPLDRLLSPPARPAAPAAQQQQPSGGGQ